MISNENTRLLLTIPKTLKEKLEAIAKNENRSLTNLIITTLSKSVEK